jgi:hypothetical protein
MLAETPFFCPPVRINSSPLNNLRVYGKVIAKLIGHPETELGRTRDSCRWIVMVIVVPLVIR